MDVLIVTIKPPGPDNEFLIRLSKEIKEERSWNITKDDPLKINKQDVWEVQIIDKHSTTLHNRNTAKIL